MLKEKKKMKIGYKILMLVLIAIIAVSGFQIGKILLNYYTERKANNEITQIAKSKGNDIAWDKLSSINSDIIAWLKIKDTKIDYPIVSAPDNDKYLHVNFRGEAADSGTLFADANTVNPFNQFLTIIYGHHMKDGSMFNNLKKFKEREFFDTHQNFKLFTPNKSYNVKIVAFCNPSADSKLYQPSISTEAEISNYISLLNDEAEYMTDAKINTNSKLVMLSTCAYEYNNARYVIVGLLT